MMGDFGLLLIGLAAAGAVFLVSWAIAAAGAWCVQAFRRAVWTRALYLASEHPETLAKVIPVLLELGVTVDPGALEAQMPRTPRKFLETSTTEVAVVEPVVNELDLDLTPAVVNDMYFAAAQDAWARARELEAEVASKDELRARYLRRVRRIEEALQDPDADVFAAVHPFLAREQNG